MSDTSSLGETKLLSLNEEPSLNPIVAVNLCSLCVLYIASKASIMGHLFLDSTQSLSTPN